MNFHWKETVAAAAVLAAISGGALAVTDTNFTYTAFKAGVFAIGPGDVIPENNTISYTVNANVLDTGGGCFVAPIHLPQDVWLYSVSTGLISDVGSDPVVSLVRTAINNSATTLNSGTLVDDTGSPKTLTFTITNNAFRLVKNDLYSYHVRICMGVGDSLYGARVTYHYNSAGD